MTLFLYNKLDIYQKIDLLYKQGALVGSRSTDEHHVFLYQLHAFYVEVFYEMETDKLVRLHCFKSTHQLKPYLEQIDLGKMLS